jgi:GTP-binding protein Era
MQSEKFRSGYVSITGRTNVGKSTLLNTILGEKIAIVAPKPQTTRNRIVGIKNTPDCQIIFIDTPGIHKPKHMLGEIMVRESQEAAKEVDIVLLVVEPEAPGKGDNFIIETLRGLNKPVFLIINKVDTVKKLDLLPVIEKFNALYKFNETIPISAITGDGVDILLKTIIKYLPEGPKYFPDDILTDQVERFMVSEIIRENVIRATEDEVPHSVAVDITDWSEREDGVIFIKANFYVEREGQKGIIIGKGGEKLKTIGSLARLEIEKLLGTKVFLELWVKVKKDWRSNAQALRVLGFR